MVKREMVPEKRTANRERLSNLKTSYDQLKSRFNQAKQTLKEKERQQLLSTPTSSAYSQRSSQEAQVTEALLKDRESRTLDYAGSRIDEIISIGQHTLESVRNQRGTLKVKTNSLYSI